jgi:hypothetical protein
MPCAYVFFLAGLYRYRYRPTKHTRTAAIKIIGFDSPELFAPSDWFFLITSSVICPDGITSLVSDSLPAIGVGNLGVDFSAVIAK